LDAVRDDADDQAALLLGSNDVVSEHVQDDARIEAEGDVSDEQEVFPGFHELVIGR
jgi:hypothetical protein